LPAAHTVHAQVGEVIGEPGSSAQYEVYATHGKGVFSSVLRARDLGRRDHDTGAVPEVAIKVGGLAGWVGRVRTGWGEVDCGVVVW